MAAKQRFSLELIQQISFRDLMQFRIHEILVVSSLYDAFTLEEDGRLTELIFTEYQDMNLSNAPRVTRVSSAKHALTKLAKKHFDLVITMSRLPDMHPFDFGKQVKESFPKLPVILLASHQREYHYLISQGKSSDSLDKIFFWFGDSSLFTAIIKFIEDRLGEYPGHFPLRLQDIFPSHILPSKNTALINRKSPFPRYSIKIGRASCRERV